MHRIHIWTLAALFTAGVLHAAPFPFLDDFESGLTNWTTNGLWGRTTARSASPSHAVTDTPGSYYANNSDSALTLASGVNLTGAFRPVLSFQHSHSLEAFYDFGRVEISIDGGITWIQPALAVYTGSQPEMVREQLDLGAYAGTTDFRFRFRLVTDGSVVMDGWYIDDVRLGEAPLAVDLHSASAPSPNAIDLAWTASAAPDFAGYRILRSPTPGADWREAREVATLTDRAMGSYTDFTVAPKTTYSYRIMVLNTSNLHALSDEISVTTPPGMDFPFLDNGEAGTGFWIADPPWALSDEAAASGAYAWSDSPGENYADLMASQSLTLAAPIRLAGRATAPVLSFLHRHKFGPGDSGRVEVSVNGGADWSSLAVFTGQSPEQWQRGRYSLAAHTTAEALLVRFRLTSDASGNDDGWHIDDISIAESPTVVQAPLLHPIESHAVGLTWAPNTDPQFSHYAIFRSTEPGVDLNSTLVAIIPQQSATTHTDTGLAMDTFYSYRVYAVNPYGAFSPTSDTESSTRTLNHPAPFLDDFESGLLAWNVTGSWNLTDLEPHSGAYCLTDSPATQYANNTDTWALTAVDLRGTTWPVLRFWDRYRLADNDWALLEVSADGNQWTAVYGAAGLRPQWAEQSIDLSPWKNQGNLRVRFRLITDGSITEDGWSIDQVSVAEHTPVPVVLPFQEGFEGDLSRWLHSGWSLTQQEAYAGQRAIWDTPQGRMTPNTQLGLVLGGEVDLTGAVDPQLTFWVRGQLLRNSYLRLHASSNGGLTWTELPAANLNSDWTSDWRRVQVPLTAYAGQTIRLRFQTSCDYRAPASDILLDKITLEEAPAAVSLGPPVPGLRSVELNWTATSLGSAFQRYEVYRATRANVTVQDTRIGSFADPGMTGMTDAGLSIGTTYYYRVFTVNSNDTYAPSNERSTTTVPLTLPVIDSMDTLDSWVTTGSWGVENGSAHEGAGYLNDSPDSEYANNTDTWALTAVDLRGTTWPVLRFWDRYRLADNDWALLEVSADGNQWTAVYGAAGLRPQWAGQSVDLSPWKNQGNLRVRFRLITDGSITEDGWSIDQVSVAEHTPVPVVLPFQEGFEGDLSRWLHSGWSLTQQEAYAGQRAIWDTPQGRMTPNTQLGLVLGGEVDLTGAVDPQLTFWVRGQLLRNSYLRLHASSNGGLTWTELPAANLNSDWTSDWRRMQVPLTAYAGQTLRLRFQTSCDYRAPASDILLDKITLEEAPAAVTLLPISEVEPASLRLTWTGSTLANFQAYRVYRSETPVVTEASTRIATITDRTQTSVVDTGLWSRRTYYYRVFVDNTNDTGTGSNQASAMTTGFALPLHETFDEPQPGWTFTGSWTIMPGAGLEGGGALVDSPGDYAPNSETFAQFGVDLTGYDWPILRFRDRSAIANHDFGMLWISPDAGGSWTRAYSVTGTRAEWMEQIVDLSPWKNREQVWIRFVLRTDGSIENDGWLIDNLSVENLNGPSIQYPFFETFENGLDRWLQSGWALSTNQPLAGLYAVHDTPTGRIGPDTVLWLTLAGELDLSTALNPQLAFWIRGQLNRNSYFRVQVSTNGGLAWADLSSANLNSDWSGDWTRVHLPLTAYKGQVIRLRFQTSSDYRAPEVDIFLDQIGIGEDAPSAPTLLMPLPSAIVEAARPTLAVINAIEYQSEPVVYQFEVYADAALTMLAAQNPGVAAGLSSTAWQVDINLQNNQQYWWRCRAVEGENAGPWMPSATFFINEVNNPPYPVVPVVPPSWILANTDSLLTWFPTTDPDMGDSIRAYHLQVSPTATFDTLLIHADDIAITNPAPGADWTLSIPLSRFPGSTELLPGTVYYWRVRAQDSRYLWSDWNAVPVSFAFVHPPASPETTLRPVRFHQDGTMTLEWDGATAGITVEYSPSLNPPVWIPVAGPVDGTALVIIPDAEQPTGFYRLRLE